MKTLPDCKLADGFSLPEKLYAQLSFFAMAITGTVGIAVADWRWALPYLLLHVYGVPGIIMRHVICPRCPHILAYDDCLQAPPRLTKLLIKARKTTPLSTAETAAHYLIFLLIPVFPLYWLPEQPFLLAVFATSAVAWYAGQFLYFCKRCRNAACPFNRAT